MRRRRPTARKLPRIVRKPVRIRRRPMTKPQSPQNAALLGFYEPRGFPPAGSPRAATAAIRAMKQATAEGLRAADYRIDPPPRRTADAAAWDIQFTTAFLRYAKDMRSGRVVP